MPEWMPEPIWEGQEAFVIGGGPSLRGFDWSLLRDENTVGCNNAFRLGPDICKICFFADRKFIFSGPNKPRKGFYDELAKFPNPVVTNDTQLKTRPEPWIKWMPRKPKGLHRDAIGYNANSGACAINLALLLGAKTIYLLGIDMHLDDKGQSNYHEHLIDKPSREVYHRMLGSFGHVSKDLLAKFPECKVINVNKNSALRVFAKVDPDVFWKERKSHGEFRSRDGANCNDVNSVGCGAGSAD
jgi:hypothetical protein